MSHGVRKNTRDHRVLKILNWIGNKERFKASDMNKDLGLTTQEVVRLFPRIDGIERLPGKEGWWVVCGELTLGYK